MPISRRFLTAAACIAGAVCGCQSPQSQSNLPLPPATPPAPAVAETPAPSDLPASTSAAESASASEVLSPADAVARQAEQHAAAIEALLNARQIEDARARGVKIVEAVPAPVVSAPEESTPPAPTAAASSSSVESPSASSSAVTAAPTVVASSAQPRTPVILPAPSEVRFEPLSSRDAGPSSVAMESQSTGVHAAAAEPVRLPEGVQVRTAAAAPVDSTSYTPAAGVAGSLELALAKRAREYPRDLASQLDHQLVLFLKDQPVPDAQALGSLTQEDRDILTALMDGLSNFRNAVRDDNNMLMNRKIRPLVEMSERLRTRADLAIPAAVLCKEVRGYGLYTPIEPTRFEAGVTHQVIVYCEIDNFSSQINDKQLWETRLEQEIVLYTETGLPVWNDKKTQYVDASRNRRRDFFVNKIITLPANLTFGRYVLKITMTDVHANRVAETSIPISVVAK